MDFPVYLHDISSKNPGLIDSGAFKEKLSIFTQILFSLLSMLVKVNSSYYLLLQIRCTFYRYVNMIKE